MYSCMFKCFYMPISKVADSFFFLSWGQNMLWLQRLCLCSEANRMPQKNVCSQSSEKHFILYFQTDGWHQDEWTAKINTAKIYFPQKQPLTNRLVMYPVYKGAFFLCKEKKLTFRKSIMVLFGLMLFSFDSFSTASKQSQSRSYLNRPLSRCNYQIRDIEKETQ